MKRIHKILAGTAGALSLVVMTAVAAAPEGTVGPYQGMGPGFGGMGMMHGGAYGGMHGGMYGGMYGGGPAAMSAQYLTGLKTALAITPQQETAWQAFAAKASEQAAVMQATHLQQHQAIDATTPAPDRMAQRLGLMTQHLAGMQAVNAAFKDLYAVLTPQQRSVADQQFGFMGSRGFGRGMHG